MSGKDSPYVELRTKSFFSFLQSTVDPEDLAKAAASAGYSVADVRSEIERRIAARPAK